MNPPGEEGGGTIQQDCLKLKRNWGGRGGTVCKSTTRVNYLQFDKSARRHCLRCGGQVGVRWPIYRATLLVSVVLIQPIPIICGVSCINSTDSKENHLWSRPR
jgi:hypothetical protein